MRKRDSHFFSFSRKREQSSVPFSHRKTKGAARSGGAWIDGIDVVRARSYSETLLPCSAAAAGVSENSATSTEMLWVIGFQLHFLTSATSAIGM